jgi:hypothetical protein
MEGPGQRRPSALWAYAISAASTMLWVGCVLPAGRLVDPSLLEDLRTPIHRASVLLVPALLLLIVGPVAVTIARTAVGVRAILASVDAFVCAYAAIALAVLEPCPGLPMFRVLVGTLVLLAVLSVGEIVRWVRSVLPGHAPPRPVGLRLAIAALVLLLPSWLLVQPGCELASLLAPFAAVALSAGGARVARTQKGLRLTAALVHLGVAGHLFVTLRYTIYAADPPFANVGGGGYAVLGAAVLVLALAGLHLAAHVRARRDADAGADAEAEAAALEGA